MSGTGDRITLTEQPFIDLGLNEEPTITDGQPLVDYYSQAASSGINYAEMIADEPTNGQPEVAGTSTVSDLDSIDTPASEAPGRIRRFPKRATAAVLSLAAFSGAATMAHAQEGTPPAESSEEMSPKDFAYQCRNQAHNSVAGLGYKVKRYYKGERVRSRKIVAWEFSPDYIDPKCKNLGRSAVSFYAASFSESDRQSERPRRLGSTVTIKDSELKEGKVFYKRVQRLRKAVPRHGASAVVTTKWVDEKGLLGPVGEVYKNVINGFGNSVG